MKAKRNMELDKVAKQTVAWQRSLTADEQYTKELQKMNGLVKKVQEKMAWHEGMQSQDRKNWGYVGDLQHYNELLQQILGGE